MLGDVYKETKVSLCGSVSPTPRPLVYDAASPTFTCLFMCFVAAEACLRAKYKHDTGCDAWQAG